MWQFGGYLANGIDNFFRLGPDLSDATVTLPGIELAIVPLTVIAAARLRFGVDRILALRASRVGPLLPLLMAASLFGLATYLVGTWMSPQAAFGLQLEFGPLRWLGIVLAAGFTWVWMPLFPQVSATLAGMIAGPALFAIIGYSFFPECIPKDVGWEQSYAGGLLVVGPLATLVWAGGARSLLFAALCGLERRDHAGASIVRNTLLHSLLTLMLLPFGSTRSRHIIAAANCRQSTKLDEIENLRADICACSVGELGVTAPRTTPSTVEQRSGRSELTAGRLRVGVRHSECGRHSHLAMCSTDLDRTAPQRLSGARRLRPDVAR